MSWTKERSRIARLHQSSQPDHAAIAEARRNMRAEYLAEYVRKYVAAAPPLTAARPRRRRPPRSDRGRGMTAGPERSSEPAVASMPTDSASVAPTADTTTAPADVPPRAPTLAGRWVRARTVYEVRTRFLVDGETETRLFRREGAALGYAGRLRAQGYPVAISCGTISWSPR